MALRPNDVRLIDLSSEEEGTDALLASAKVFMSAQPWALLRDAPWLGDSIPGVMGVFYFELIPKAEEYDDAVWVVVGDLPPACFSPKYASSTGEAVAFYVLEMRKWVKAVSSGVSTEDLMPVNAAATAENAQGLHSRLDFIESRILPYYPKAGVR